MFGLLCCCCCCCIRCACTCCHFPVQFCEFGFPHRSGGKYTAATRLQGGALHWHTIFASAVYRKESISWQDRLSHSPLSPAQASLEVVTPREDGYLPAARSRHRQSERVGDARRWQTGVGAAPRLCIYSPGRSVSDGARCAPRRLLPQDV